MGEGKWMQVAKESALAQGKPVKGDAGGAEVALVKLNGEVCACGHDCPHYGGPLSEGLLVGDQIVCPWHSARIDLKTGEMVEPPALDGVARYPVKVENGKVMVGEAREPAWPELTRKDDRVFVIVGGGASGNSAAETLRREGFAGRIVMITREKDLPYDRPNLSKQFMSGEAKAEWIPLRPKGFYAERGIEVMTGAVVTGFKAAARTVALEDGEEVKGDAVLLATGGEPKRPDVPGMNLSGVFTLRSLSDAKRIVAAVEKAKRVVVLGASFIGMEVAASLKKRKLDVTVVAPEDVPMKSVFGERVGKWLAGKHQEKGVKFQLGRTATRIMGSKRVEGVELSDGTKLAAELVIVGVGVRPAVGYLEGSGLVEAGMVSVDGRLETKVKGVYAAGDIAGVVRAGSEEVERVEHWVVAERMGQHAARSMLGGREEYKTPAFFWTRQFDLGVQYVGYVRGVEEEVVRGDVEKGAFVTGYFKGGVLRAAAGTGRGNEVLEIGECLRRGEEITVAGFSKT